MVSKQQASEALLALTNGAERLKLTVYLSRMLESELAVLSDAHTQEFVVDFLRLSAATAPGVDVVNAAGAGTDLTSVTFDCSASSLASSSTEWCLPLRIQPLAVRRQPGLSPTQCGILRLPPGGRPSSRRPSAACVARVQPHPASRGPASAAADRPGPRDLFTTAQGRTGLGGSGQLRAPQ